jgi:ubiquinone/menaquinone biosynthesis C-methylase UbiE
MEPIRKPFQGVWNIVRFNGHFYFFSLGCVFLILFMTHFLKDPYPFVGTIVSILMVAILFISLLVSFYAYDLSPLYTLDWLCHSAMDANSKIVNIHAGFDEISRTLKNKFQNAELMVFDFYDPSKHTEISIMRARKIYPPFPHTKPMNTSKVPLPNDYADKIFLFFSAHEIRNEKERDVLFKELHRVLKRTGSIVVTEHLRNLLNFLVYTIGFFHFIALSSWMRTFQHAGFHVSEVIKITPFITTFILKKNGTAS